MLQLTTSRNGSIRVELRDEAIGDLVEGAAFYREQSMRLDEHFLECLRSDLKFLATTAGVHELYREFHRAAFEAVPFRNLLLGDR